MPYKRGAASPTRNTSAKHRKKSHHGARANTQRKPADTIAPLTGRTDARDRDSASAPSVIICEYCRSRCNKLSQQQLATLPEADDVENHGIKYRAGDMVEVKVRSKGQKSRLERAVIAEIGNSSVFVAWLFETEKTKARKQLLEGKIDPSHKFILSSHADTVPVDALVGLVSPNERKEVCTDWVLHSNAAQVICITELRDGCFMRSLVEKVRVKEPSGGSAAPSGAPDSTLPQQETNSPSAPEQEENGELVDLQNQPTPFLTPVEQPEALASGLEPDALKLEKPRKEEEGRAKAGARKRAAEDARMAEEAKKMTEEGPKIEERRQILGARGSSPDDHEAKEENRSLSNNEHSRSAPSARSPRMAKRHKLGAPPSTVSQDVPGEGLSSVSTLPDQLGFPSDKDLAGGEGRRSSLCQRGAIMDALKTNNFEQYMDRTGLTVNDIHSLIPKDQDGQLPCLNDNIIDGYLTMLAKKACEKDWCAEADKGSNKVRPCGAVTCFWRQSENVLLRNSGLLSSVNNLFMPVCDGKHWGLLVISGQRRTIQYFDSLHYPSTEIVDKVREWVKRTLGDAYNEDDWKTIEEQHSPQQDNTVDCGVAVLLNARAIAMGLPVHSNLYSFERKVMLSVRYELAVDLLSLTVDLEALPSAIKIKNGSESIEEIPATKNENATEAVQTVQKRDPGKSVATMKYVLDASDFWESGPSYEEEGNNSSRGNQINTSGDGEDDDHPLPTSPCRSEAQVKDKDTEGAATAAGADTEGSITVSGEESEEPMPPLKAPNPPTEHGTLSFRPSANDADENGSSDPDNQNGRVDLEPRLCPDRLNPSISGLSALDATESERQGRETSSSFQNDGATQKSGTRAKVQTSEHFKEGKDCTPDVSDEETERWLRDTITGLNGILSSPPPLSEAANKVPATTGAKPQARAFTYQRDQSALRQGENSSLDDDPTLVNSKTSPTFREQDKFMPRCDIDLTDEAHCNDTRSVTYSSTADGPAAGQKTGNIEVEVAAGSPVSQGFTDTGPPSTDPESDLATKMSNFQNENGYTQRFKDGAFNFQPEIIPPMHPRLTRTGATRPPQRLGSKKTREVGTLRYLPHGLSRRLRQHSSQGSLPPMRIDPADLPLDYNNNNNNNNNNSETRDNVAEEQITSLRYRPGATSTGTLRVRNPFDGTDSRPATPQISWNNAGPPPPKAASVRKGISVLGMSRPTEVKEKDWKGCSFVREASDEEAPRGVTDTPLTPELRPPLWDTVVWVMFPDNYLFHESSTLAIHNCPKDLKKLGHDTWLADAPQSGLGDLAVWREKNGGGTWVHQGLVTMLAVKKFSSSFSVRLHEWDWLMCQLQKHQKDNLLSTCSNSDGQPQSTVIFIHATTQKPSEILQVYEDLRMLRLTSGARIRTYPNIREWRQDQEKIEDIQALDEIAKSSGRPEYSYRPITCFGGLCKLQNYDKTVLKRSHSEGKNHVKIIHEDYKEWEAIDRLTCTYQPQKAKKRVRSKLIFTSDQPQKTKRSFKKHKKEDQKDQEERAAFGVRPHWFHQEYVSGLYYGEFRVFMRSETNNEEGTRVRKSKVLAVAWTSWDDKGGLHVVKADENHFSGSPNSKCGALSKSDLEDFCLYVFERLRARNSPCYESLEVGVRLDVGVADSQGQKRFFVNEITRWYNAHYFSYTILAKPYTEICKAFAKAFSNYVQDGMPEVVGWR
ncbi:hypothetical protein B0J12DRAFT_788067 [Macrophomina phaseolina]|uniref:Ubiquitin-like protease family profile domain-containing protein n=1 Tax=Macrophomina phaseolina TaxID=35725 RepID=A0ABQ8G1R8_9PEZI|nr:hypothetical protein B0J12DRAFT_788067 [Macrophomina phaseolina]